MKRKSLWNSLLVFCLIGFGTIASFISCEVGLGSAVDVAAPDINITTPPTAAVIRQSFAIAGDWSDDGTIKSLEVTLKNTNTKKEYKLNEGNVKQQEDTKDFKGKATGALQLILLMIKMPFRTVLMKPLSQ